MPLMIALGIAVADGSTPVDDWFQQARGGVLRWFLFFTDLRPMVLLLLTAAGIAVAARRWLLVSVMIASPFAAVMMSRTLKRLFERTKEDALAYPSGHTTLMVVVLGMVILALGVHWWSVIFASLWALLGIVGQAVTYHYFTDAVGAVLFGSSVVCLAAVIVWRGEHPSFIRASP